jgi:hypothetical protein
MIRITADNMKKECFLHAHKEGFHVMYNANAQARAKAWGATYTIMTLSSIFVYAYPMHVRQVLGVSFSLLIASVQE